MAKKKEKILTSEREFNKKYSTKYLKKEVGEEVDLRKGEDIEMTKFRKYLGGLLRRNKNGVSMYEIKKFLNNKKVTVKYKKRFEKAFIKKKAEKEEKSTAEKRKIMIKRDESGDRLGGSGNTGLDSRRGLFTKIKRKRYNVTAEEKKLSTPVKKQQGGLASSKLNLGRTASARNLDRTASALGSKSGNTSVVNRPSGGVAKSAGKISTGPINNNSISINQK